LHQKSQLTGHRQLQSMKYNYSKQKLQKKQQKTTRQLHFIEVFYFGKDFQQNLKPDPSAMLLFQVDMINNNKTVTFHSSISFGKRFSTKPET